MICTRCKTEKQIDQFGKIKKNKNGLHSWCSPCANTYRQEWREKNRPMVCLSRAKCRCENKNQPSYRYYGERGIKILLSKEDVLTLWKRDLGFKMKWPTLDRINPDGHYELSNCRFLEQRQNSGARRNPGAVGLHRGKK